MKDYSVNLGERKDFILCYDITKDGSIIVKFVKGKPWIIPYNETNEKIILDKMKEQVLKIPDGLEFKLNHKRDENILMTAILLFSSFLALSLSLTDMIYIPVASVLATIGMVPLIATLKVNSKLQDLKRNKKFLEMEEKLNSKVRSDQNILVDVSSKTKKAIKGFPEDKPVFNINSFNYVPFKDLEQIMENDARNERFGFVYEEIEREKKQSKTRKKIR